VGKWTAKTAIAATTTTIEAAEGRANFKTAPKTWESDVVGGFN
jgi:hypothetical protein